MDKNKLLKIRDLKVQFNTREGTISALNGVDLDLFARETLGVVGESGCGKSMTARSILGLIPKAGRITEGTIEFYSENGTLQLTGINSKENIRSIRGKTVGMIFQEPMTSFSPIHTIGDQIGEVVRLHLGFTAKEARQRTIEVLSLVGIPDAKARVDTYPFELSGGMRQRAMIAMALVCNPALLIADEPTTALDVTIQAQILELLRDVQKQLGMSIMLISHNLGVVAALAERIAVMYLGRVVETGTAEEILSSPKHPYTQGLMQSIPVIGQGGGDRLKSIQGTIPDPYTAVSGCPFHPRCSPRIAGVCDNKKPELTAISPSHRVACVLYEEQGGLQEEANL